MVDRWIVMLSGDNLVDELRKLPDDVMSFVEATNQVRLSPAHTIRTPLILGTIAGRNKVYDGS